MVSKGKLKIPVVMLQSDHRVNHLNNTFFVILITEFVHTNRNAINHNTLWPQDI